jgi:hypothetical protein
MAFNSNESVIPEAHRQVLTGSVEVNEDMLMENAVAQQLGVNRKSVTFWSARDCVRRIAPVAVYNR